MLRRQVTAVLALGLGGWVLWRLVEFVLGGAEADRRLVLELARRQVPVEEPGSVVAWAAAVAEQAEADSLVGWDPSDADVPDLPDPREPPWGPADVPGQNGVDPEGVGVGRG